MTNMGFTFSGYQKPAKFRLFTTTRARLLGLVSLLALLTAPVAPPSRLPVAVAATTTTISVCDEAHLLAALAVGGDITFGCSGTITLTTTPVTGIVINSSTNLDASGQNVTIDGGGTRGIFSLASAVPTVTLKNLTLTHAGGTGAIYNNQGAANLNIINTTFSNNTTGFGGTSPAIYNLEGNLTITNSLFLSNTEGIGDSGGAILSIGFGNLTITNTRFIGNTAPNTHGGALITEMVSANIVDSTFTNNTSNRPNGAAGAIFNIGKLSVRNSTFTNNTVNGSNGAGGAIYNLNELKVINSTFVGNASGSGAVIYTTGPQSTTITNIINSTLTANTGGTALEGAGGSSLNVVNSIVANSPAGNCLNPAGSISGHHNLETGITTTCGTNSLLTANPLLGPLADNGGPTQTLALLAGSPAIDGADNAVCLAEPPNGAGKLDQRGVARPQGQGCDIGAFELDPSVLAAPSALRAATFSPTRIDLSWQANTTTPTGFSLQRKAGADGTYAPVATLPVNTTSFSDTPLAADTTYFYRVQATQDGLVSAFSNEVSATTGAANLVVTLPTDDGGGTVAGSLSAALLQANAGQVITFNLTGGASIAVRGQLPTPKAGISIDGGSCPPGAGGGPRLSLDGTGTPALVNGLQFNKGATLKNLRLKGFGGRQLVVLGGAGSLQLQCVVASKA